MTNIKLYTTTALIALMALAAPAFAVDGNVNAGNANNAPAPQQHHMHKHHAHKHMGGAFRNDKAAFEKMHALHKRLHEVVVADKFDKKAFLSLTSQIDQLHSQIERRHAEAFANKLAQMSPDERADLAEKFHEHMMMHHDGHGWDHEDGGWNHRDWSHGGWDNEHNDRGDDGTSWSHAAEENGMIDGREIPNH